MAKVLIVGAGPVGLTAGVELSRLGHQVKIIDKNAHRSTVSKAIGINPQSLTLLESAKVTPDLLAEGIKVQKFYLHYKQKALEVHYDLLDYKYNFMLALPQDRTEALLENALNRYGCYVDRQTEFLSAQLQPEGVLAQIKTPDDIATESFDFLIGADGAHSLVRKMINADFIGHAFEENWNLVDLHLQWPGAQQTAHAFIPAPGQVLVMIPIANDRYRLVSNTTDAIALLPKNSKVQEIIWQSDFKIHSRLSSKYQEERIFLIGDAAHIHTPVGGRGMNLGIEDAVTLAKLIHQDQWQIYHQLRHPVGLKVVQETDKAYRMMTLRNPIGIFFRNHVLFPLLSLSRVQKKQIKNIAGLTTDF